MTYTNTDIKAMEKEVKKLEKIQKVTDTVFAAVLSGGMVALIGVIAYATMFGNLAQYI